MRFARHLVSHLTPEWRKHYIRYYELKKLIYAMVKKVEPSAEAKAKGMSRFCLNACLAS